MSGSDAIGAVTGVPRLLLRVEGGALFLAAASAYFWLGHPWWLFLVLFFTPDLAFLGYLRGPQVGAIAYNTVHVTLGPLALGAVGVLSGNTTVTALALIWAAHVGIDRAFGYGLKYGTAFTRTHLGTIGRG